jgi:DNA-binding CsgD family transcriptional regulator
MNKLIHKSQHTSDSVSQSVSQSQSLLSTLQTEAQFATPSANSLLFQGNRSAVLLRGVIESLMDGVLILTEQGKLVNANSNALKICHQLMEDWSTTMAIPQQIWNICRALIDSRDLFPEHTVTIEDEISISKTTSKQEIIRLRARWVTFDEVDRPYLLVVLEDRSQSLKDLATLEAHKYGLTEREKRVWELRRANRTYKAIAAELFITVDTVKKHLKSIHAKRDAFHWASE